MRQTITILILFFLAAMPLSLQATHIVGGEMTYKCLGNDLYEVKLTIFRDCFNGIPWFDDPAAIGVFSNSTNLLLENVLVPLDPMLNDTLDPTLDDDCLVVPPNVCVNTTTYTTTINLPFIPGGYHLVYQRCCRNNTIANLVMPEDVGATYSIEVGEDALLECNTSPVFNEWPPLFLCAGVPFNIDQSAVDDDGDSLVYRLCNPLTGANDIIPQPVPPNPPPYDTVPFFPPFDVNNFTNNPPVNVMTIDSETGLLTGTPNLLGQFVIGICVEEYRNGVLIGTNRRDYQVNIGDCQVITSSFFTPEVICDGLTVSLDNLSMNANDFLWMFNDPANPGATSTAFEPSYTYSEIGTYTITLISEPGEICADTSTAQITFQPNSISPDFDVQVTQCTDDVLVQVTDLSVDTFSVIDTWNWTLVINGNVYESDDQNPSFTLNESGTAVLNLFVASENGCSQVIEEVFQLKSTPLMLDLGPDLEFCGPQNVTLDAGPGFVSYEWSTTDETQTIDVSEEGTYSVTATDACGASLMDEVNIVIDTLELMLPDSVFVCLGETFTFDVPGFETYEWSPSDYLDCTDCPNPTSTPEMDITYMLTATSADGCVNMGSTNVFVLPSYASSLTFEVCEGETITYAGTDLGPGAMVDFTFTAENGCDSIVTVTVDGLPNFETSESISICAGETVDIFGIPTNTAGVYDSTFVASNGCDSTHTITLVVFDAIDINIQSTNATCFGAADGSATAEATGGTPDYTYEWSTSDVGPTISGQPAGTYTVTVTDSEGCTGEATVTIEEPTEIEVEVNGINVGCDELGSAIANASGGTPGYTYEWSNGESGNSIIDIVAGTYTVTATDDNGCTGTGSIEITGALGPNLTVIVDQQLTEDMPMDGALSADIDGGTAPFTVDWSNGDTGVSLTGLGSGEYIATVTDANGCTAVDTAYLFVPACTGGKIWEDTDRDGCQEGGELGLGGIMLELSGVDIWGNNITATTVSAINGEYIFEDLPPGDYTVFLPVPAGYTLSPADACADDFTDSDFDMNGVSFVVNLEEGHCCLIVDGGLYDSCLNVIDPGTICCDQTLCGPGNTPDLLTGTPASGAGGAIEYMWVYSHTDLSTNSGSWTPIPNTNTANYQPGAVYQTTYFARCVRAIGCEEWLEGNSVEVLVDDEAVAQIEGLDYACVGDEVTYSSGFDNGPGASYQWNFGPWASPSTATGEEATVTWNQAGVVYITLSVEANGCTSTAQLGLAISDSPIYCDNLRPGNTNGFSLSAELGVSLYPNPVQDEINVTWDEAIEENLSLELLRIDGSTIQSLKVDGMAMSHQIDVQGLSAGMYLLQIRNNQGDLEVFKFVKE